jgi:hypothetical protein
VARVDRRLPVDHLGASGGALGGIGDRVGCFGPSLPELYGTLALFGAITIIAGVVQVVMGLWIDRANDLGIVHQLLWAPWYPVCYWILSVATVLRKTLPGLIRRPRGLSTWTVPREKGLLTT